MRIKLIISVLLLISIKQKGADGAINVGEQLENDAQDLAPLIHGQVLNELNLAPGQYRANETIKIKKKVNIGPSTIVNFEGDADIIILGGNLNINCSSEFPCHFKNMRRMTNNKDGRLSINNLLITDSEKGIVTFSEENHEFNHLTMRDSEGIFMMSLNPSASMSFNYLRVINISTKNALQVHDGNRATIIVRDSVFEDVEIGIGPWYNAYSIKYDLEVTNSNFTARINGSGTVAIVAANRPNVNITGNRFSGFKNVAIDTEPFKHTTDNELNTVIIHKNIITDCHQAISINAAPYHEFVIIDNAIYAEDLMTPEDHIWQIAVKFDRVDRSVPSPSVIIKSNAFQSLRNSAVRLEATSMAQGDFQFTQNLMKDFGNEECRVVSVHTSFFGSKGPSDLPDKLQVLFSDNMIADCEAHTVFYVERFEFDDADNCDVLIRDNTISNNTIKWAVLTVQDQAVTFEHNTMLDNHLKKSVMVVDSEDKLDLNNRTSTVQAQYNYWGTVSEAEIAELIDDGDDFHFGDSEYIKANWHPFCTEPDC